MELRKEYATNDPYAKNRDSVWLGGRKKRAAIPWSKLWLPAVAVLVIVLFFALREPKEDDLPGAKTGVKPANRSGTP